MKYYLDTEFIEGFHKPLLGKKRHFIDLISIGIVAEDGREYYAISKEFDLRKAYTNKWIRQNVLLNVYEELYEKLPVFAKQHFDYAFDFNIWGMEALLKAYGKSNKQISEEIKAFTANLPDTSSSIAIDYRNQAYKPEFYAYYADYDWVIFASLFGTMMDLPKGYPMYCRDLKQMLDEKVEAQYKPHARILTAHTRECWGRYSLDSRLTWIKEFDKDYPKQQNEHNALDDAKWNKELHKFIANL